MVKAICKGAETLATLDGPRIRITQPKAVAAFFGLYNAYRLPDAQTSFKLVGRTDMYSPPVIGNYLLSTHRSAPPHCGWSLGAIAGLRKASWMDYEWLAL